jgi:hypothetical protein
MSYTGCATPRQRAGYISTVTRRRLPGWLIDARLWMTVFVLGFWPVVWFTHIVGCIVLLAFTFGSWYGLQAIDRRAQRTATEA